MICPEIRIMSFNVQGYEDEEDATNHWTRRAALNVKTIKRYAPDVIGFQELTGLHMATYREHLPEYDHTPLPAEDTFEEQPIYWKKDRYELLDSAKFWLSPTPEVPSTGWGVEEDILAARWVKLRALDTDAEFVHLNTHFEDGGWGEQSRQESSKLIASRLDQLQAGELPAFVTGDFNCNPWDPAYRIFMRNGFTDAYRAAGNADTEASSTFHGFRGKDYFGLEWGGSIFWRVDWILTRDGASRAQTTACTIVRDAEPPLYPSDHYPVVAEVMLIPR